jgi:hypothetical protein
MERSHLGGVALAGDFYVRRLFRIYPLSMLAVTDGGGTPSGFGARDARAFAGGAEIGGIVGIYLAVPLMASFCIVWRSVGGERTKRDCVSDREAAASTSSNLVETAIS